MFVRRFAEREGVDVPRTSSAALEALYRHDWPGNVRELENAAERAVILSHGARIEVGHLPSSAMTESGKLSQLSIPGASMAEIEKAAILETLAAVDGSTSRCAEILGISVRKIQYRLNKWRKDAAQR
jgi:two-component system response regulator HydG